MKLSRIMEWIEAIAPLSLQENYDNSGLLIGSADKEIDRVVVCLDADAKTLDLAHIKGAQLVISHHPCIFRPLKALDPGSAGGSAIYSAITGDIAVYAAHTNFDSARGGLGDILCGEIGLESTSVLKPNAARPEHGIGRVGSFAAPVPHDDFLEVLRKRLGIKAVREVGNRPDTISKVAVINGSFDQDLMQYIWEAMPDVLLTGDLKYHDALELGWRGIYTVDAGHYGTEIIFVQAFSRMLGMAFPEVMVYPVENGDIFKVATC